MDTTSREPKFLQASLLPKPPRVVKAECVPGCPRERRPDEVCCPEHWKRVPRELKVEFWVAKREASKGRGRKNNGKSTKRWTQAFRAIVGWLIRESAKDPVFASDPLG